MTARQLLQRVLDTSMDTTPNVFPTEEHLQARRDAVHWLREHPEEPTQPRVEENGTVIGPLGWRYEPARSPEARR